jgi:hypothetical protein|tara:strand:+ start:50 stop:1594 length:1545 start_codon:yes stop_codon:yes gene_type:complete
MALRLRRGTNAERQLITPAQGELIYTTDTKALYIGDGSTAGGIIVQGGGGGASELNALTDVNVGSVTDGQVLTYDAGSSQWQPQNGAGISLGRADTLTDINYGADNTAYVGDMLTHDGNSWMAEQFIGGNHNISIVGNDSTILVDHTNSTLNGNLVSGNVVGGDIVFSSDNSVIIDNSTKTAHGLTLRHDDNSVAYNPADKIFNGDLVGNMQGSIFAADVTKVFDHATGNWTGDIQGGDIFGTDSSLLIDSHNAQFYGTMNGASVGTFSGSVFGDNSSILVDGINNKIVGEVESSSVKGANIKLGSAASNNVLYLAANAESTVFSLTTESNTGTIVSLRNTQIGGISDTGESRVLAVYNDVTTQGSTTVRTFHASDAGFGSSFGALRSRGTKASPTAVASGDQLGSYSAAGHNGTTWKAAAGIRFKASASPEANRVPANIELYNSNSAGAQTVVLQIAQTDSVASFTGPIKLPVVADDTARASAVTAPVAGMIIFNSTGTKFQGYTGAAWVDLN